MDTQKKTILLTTITGTLAVLLLLSITGGKKSGSVWSFLKKSITSSSSTRADFLKTPKNKYAVVRYNDNESSNSETQKIYNNDYQPSTTFARAYVEQEDAQHPLVASTKVIRKKDKLKKAKKLSKTIAKNKKKRNGSSSSDDFEDDFESDSEDLSTQASGTLGGGGIIGAANPETQRPLNEQEEEKLLNTVEYWERPIFIDEDFNAVMKLVDSYQVRKVSNNVFYDVVGEMAQDERINLREFGVFALAATPSSQSFSQLALLRHSDRALEIRTSAEQELARYTTAGRVNFVLGALRASTESQPNAALEAMSVLSETSRKYFSLGSLDGPNPTRADSATLLSLHPRLDTAVQLIQQKYGNATDPRIRSEAERTMAAISSNISI